MSTALSLTPALAPAANAAPEPVGARLAVYPAAGEPALVEELGGEPIEVIEDLCDLVAGRSPLPAPAVREVVENLVHAGFRDALVTVLDRGHTLRVSDHGPGIADPARAGRPGFSTAGAAERSVVRGVGGGLPLARELMTAAGGALTIEDNLGGGAVVTLSIPAPDEATVREPVSSDAVRTILALLLELGSARAERLSRELDRSRAECGRELAQLQHRGLVSREPGGACRLTDAGTALVATLF